MKATKREILTSDKKGLKKLAPKQMKHVKGGIIGITDNIAG